MPVNTKPVRFWVYINGDWVRLTLRGGDVLEWRKYERTDEGWRRTHERWQYEALEGKVWWMWESRERDCDGYSSVNGQASFDKDRAAFLFVKDGNVWIPDWQYEDVIHRDYTAEAAGY